MIYSNYITHVHDLTTDAVVVSSVKGGGRKALSWYNQGPDTAYIAVMSDTTENWVKVPVDRGGGFAVPPANEIRAKSAGTSALVIMES